VLVAYASAHGSTQGIAESIGAALERHGEQVSVRSAAEAIDVDAFDAVVLGSAVHDQRWLPEATEFADRSRMALTQQPVWLFSVGMPGALPRPLRRIAAREEPEDVSAIRDEIHPREHRLFSGAVRPDHLSRKGRVAFRALGGRYGDFRNWESIDSWGDGIARRLQTLRSD